MGILLLPAFIPGLICLFISFIVLSRRIRLPHHSLFWLLATPLISAIPYSLLLLYWSGEAKMHGIDPLTQYIFFMVVLPALLGFVAFMPVVKNRVSNTVCIVYFSSVVLSAILFFIFPQLTRPQTFFNILMTY